MLTPDDRRYSSDHEWIKVEDNNRARVGITDYAQDALGDVVFVELPEVGAQMKAGSSIGEIESTKSVSDLYAPIDGVVVEVNNDLTEEPERLNSDPYGEGWICLVELAEGATTDALLTPEAYIELTEG